MGAFSGGNVNDEVTKLKGPHPPALLPPHRMLPGRRESSTPEGGSPFDCAQGDTFFQSFIGMAPSATGGEEEALSLPQQVRQKELKPWKLFLSHHRAGGVGIGGR